MNKFKLRQSRLRRYLKEAAIDAFIIPSSDTHFGEYVQKYYNCREWLSGFSGSAGIMVVTNNASALWTDSRYFSQAAKELEGSDTILMKLRIEGTPSISQWLKEQLPQGAIIGIDGSLFSVNEYQNLINELNPLVLKEQEDPFKLLWEDRPAINFSGPIKLPDEITGESTISKHTRVVASLPVKENFLYLISSCDDIAWLCNLRGRDIDYNPLFYSYAAITSHKIYLFTAGHLKEEFKRALSDCHLTEVLDYDAFLSSVKEYDLNCIRVASPDKISISVYRSAVANGARFVPDNIRGGAVGALKAIKNEVEMNGFRKAMLEDGVAWVKFWMYLEEQLQVNDIEITEHSLADKMIKIRSESSNYMGESFAPIVAWGSNAALPHYSPSAVGSAGIEKKGFILVDTGAHYIFGTTDTTRTISLGNLTPGQKIDYTLVLKGMINLSRAIFPKGTRGSSLDFLARGPICTTHKYYMHGTGHGVGHFLCVHEGPQSIRMEENPVTIEPGMITSNEPAVYIKDEYGIRTENLILCKEDKVNESGVFYSFETLTLVPVDLSAIDKRFLNEEDVSWLQNYHNKVYRQLSPYLNNSQKEWLRIKTSYSY